MERDRLISQLRGLRRELEAAGVAHVALVGSVARDDASPGSDLDLMVTLSESDPPSLLEMISLRDSLGERLGRRVDLLTQPITNPFVRYTAERDAIAIF